MYSTVFLSALLLLASVADAALPTRTARDVSDVVVHPAVVVEKYTTNAKRLASGIAPAAPSYLRRHRARDSRLRGRTDPPAPSVTPSATPTVCVVTANAIPLWDSSSNIDDQFRQIDLPLSVQIYDQSSTSIFVSTNGVYSLLSGSAAFSNSPLPAGAVPAYSVLPFWDDTYIYAGTDQRIYYSVINDDEIVVESLFSHYMAPNEYYHYTVDYRVSNPGVFVVKYYSVSDLGNSATVGAQGMRDGAQTFTQYSSDGPVITPGLTLTIDTIQNTITAGSFDVTDASSLCA